MLRVSAAALVLCGLTAAPVFAAPLAGVEAQFYPNEYNQPDSGAVYDDILKSDNSQGGEVAESDLKGMSGGSGFTVKGNAQLNLNDATATTDEIIDIGTKSGQIGTQTLSNVSGISTIMQNTGNGVTMQSINNINVTLNN
ncbi:MAG: hypothetical protein WAW96_17815 [Alphaproteobacteria bacterium]